MGIHRSKVHYGIARAVVSGVANFYYDLEINGDRNIPKEGPVLMLSKHQDIKDIFIQGRVLGGYVGRPGNWVMKSSLPKYFEKFGGLRIVRSQDIGSSYEGLDAKELRAAKRENIREAQKYKNEIKDAMKEIFVDGELLVLHPEGTRVPYEMGKLNMSLINFAKQLRPKVDEDISLVLIGINYENIGKFRSKVAVNIDKLDWDTPDLEGAIASGIADLSGLAV